MGAGSAFRQLRDKAKRDLADAQADGLDRIVWDILAAKGSAFPVSRVSGRGDGCKGSYESVKDYLARMVHDGDAFEGSGTLYLTLDDISLEFSVSTGRTDALRERVRFFFDIAGEVEVRYNHLELTYTGWLDSALVPAKALAKRPYRTAYIIK